MNRDAPRLTLGDVERFMSKVERGHGCWHWTGHLSNGYGRLRLRGVASSYLAHRLSYFIATDVWPGDQHVCHRCDNPACVRPDHLFLGTQSDNMQDAAGKGRTRSGTTIRRGRGQLPPSCRLTVSAVRSIRQEREGGQSLGAIARRHGVHKTAIHKIVNRLTWKHVS